MNCDTIGGFIFQHLLLLIGLTERTGELVLESGNNIGSILFYKGTITLTFSPYSRAIGDLLVDDGVITEAELLEMLQLQKREANAPIGGMFLKTGKVTFNVIESMVHEQIRTAIKEFSSWPKLHATFIQKELVPFDSIHLRVHEFLMPEDLRSAKNFLSESHNHIQKNPPAPAAPTA